MSTDIVHNTPMRIELGTVGFIGCGQMGGALLSRWLERGILSPERIMVADPRTAEGLAERLGITAAPLKQVVEAADVLVLAVKPAQAVPLLSAHPLRESQLVISLVAGTSQEALLAGARPARVVRTMPNTPSQVGAGVTLVLAGPEDAPEDVALVERLFSAVGHVERLQKEALFHSGTALSGSGPAFMFMVMEALADGAVSMGMPRDQARRLAAMTVYGAGALASRPNAHPAVLKDAVTSPGGTTAAGIVALEARGTRGAFISAIQAASERSIELSGGDQ
ncbi:MAG: pyrroline-5-carboxylate reductase [Bradymonadia bacterium]